MGAVEDTQVAPPAGLVHMSYGDCKLHKWWMLLLRGKCIIIGLRGSLLLDKHGQTHEKLDHFLNQAAPRNSLPWCPW